MIKTVLFQGVGTWGVVAAIACSSGGIVENPGGAQEPEPRYDTISIIGDPGFGSGLVLKRGEGPPAGVIHPFGAGTPTPVWELAEWSSRFMLSEADRTSSDDRITYGNQGKSIAFEPGAGGVEVRMDVTASAEYDTPRQQNQAWPHLLIEQTFPVKYALKDLEGLLLRFSGRLTKAERRMTDEEFNPGLHAAQFQLFLTVQDLNPHSAYYGDFLWFGIPFYDNRYEQIPLYAAQDVGKGDATGKFIYSAGTTDFMVGTFHGGGQVTIEKDIYPIITRALELAKQRGYLTGSFFDDFRIAGMNLGWEVPGTFDVGFSINAFDLRAVIEK